MFEYNHVLFAMDYSEDAQIVGEKAKAIAARNNNAKLTVIHVIEEVSIAAGYELMPLLPDIADDETKAESKRAMIEMTKKLGISDADSMVITAFSTKEGIIRAAKDLKADLIVIGAHTRHGLSLLLGSTANAILNDAPCDVLTIKLKK